MKNNKVFNHKFFLKLALEHIEQIEKWLELKNKRDFIRSQLLQDAILCNLRRISIILKKTRSAGLSDCISDSTHDCFDPDLEMAWKVIKHDFPKLKKEINGVL